MCLGVRSQRPFGCRFLRGNTLYTRCVCDSVCVPWYGLMDVFALVCGQGACPVRQTRASHEEICAELECNDGGSQRGACNGNGVSYLSGA